MWHDADSAAIGLTRVVSGAPNAAPHTSAWAIVVCIGLSVLLATFFLTLVVISTRQPPGRGGDDDHGPGPGGGGPGRPGPDGGDAPGGTPASWADFEREFAAYVSERTAGVR
jgi:hypothetical protein